MKKLFTLVLAAMLIFAVVPSALALPANTVVIGNQAFSLDLFFEDNLPDAITTAILAGGDIYLDLDIGAGFIDAWTSAPMSENAKRSLTNISYMNADGSISVYANFDDQQPIVGKIASGKVDLITIGGITIARIYVNSSEVGSQFRLPGGEATDFTNYVQLPGTQTTSLELLDTAGNVVGTFSVDLVAGSFEAVVQETFIPNDGEFEVIDIS